MKRKKVVPRAVQAQQQAPKLNPFELKGSKKKFEILGKRDKSDKKNVIKSREEAVNKRKKTLLVEYKQLRKANTFIDRRFGEDDPRLDEEDKALARFQVHRIKEAKKATKFALSGGDGDAAAGAGGGRGGSSRGRGGVGVGGGDGVHTLTHGGISLEELEELNSRPAEALADLDDDMLEDLVASYHFGGGGGGSRGDGEGGQQQQQERGRPKSKKEIMEEIIAKSKAAKAEKAAQREADEAQLSALDTTFKALVADKGVGLAALVKPPGFDKGRKVKADTDADADYDRAARELAFEAKGQAADATLTKEELEEREAARLAALEAARLKRMRADAAAAAGEEGGGDGGGDAFEEGGGGIDDQQQQALPQGGYAAKRARARLEVEREEQRQRRKLEASGDALDENYDLSGVGSDDGDDDGSGSDDDVAAANALEARRQAAAAGAHPLQQAFREAAARLAAKHGVEVPQQQGSDSGSGSEDTEGDGSEGSEGEGVSGEEDEEEAAAADDDTGSGSGSEDGESDGDGSSSGGSEDEQEEEAPAHPTKARKQQQQAAAAASNKQPSAAAGAAAKGAAGAAAEQLLEGPLDLSFTPAVPETYDAFVALVGGRPADQLALAIQRIRTFNAAALATDSKRKLQVFYGILVQHFAMLAGQQPLPTAHLDVLTQVLLQLTPEVPFYAATVARTRLDRLHSRLSAALTNPLEASGADGPLLLGWPGPRQLLQLRLFALLFPTSDRRHPVTTPLSLLMGKYLMQCPVASGYQAAVGLLLAGLELHNAAAAARFCPEAMNFVVATLRAFLPASGGAGKSSSSGKNKAAAAAAAAAAGGSSSSSGLQPVSRFTPGLLELDCCKAAAAGGAGAGAQHGSKKRSKKQQQQQQQQSVEQQQQLPRIQLYPLLSSPPDAPQFSSDAFKLQLLGCAVSTAQRLLQLSHGCSNAEPEVLQPLAAAAEAVAGLCGLPPAALGAVRGLVAALNSRIGEVVDTRVPMVQSHRVKVVLPREFNPRFEMDFNSAADYDPDRQRSEAKKLQRQLVKEKRGAMRELRRDASFMAAERDAEKARVDAERLASERSFYSELQRQEADAKSGGQRGMNPHKKKKR